MCVTLYLYGFVHLDFFYVTLANMSLVISHESLGIRKVNICGAYYTNSEDKEIYSVGFMPETMYIWN